MSAKNAAFERVCADLERHTSLNRLQARGVIRLTLKEAALDAKTVTNREMIAVVTRVLNSKLVAQGIPANKGISVCDKLVESLARVKDEGTTQEPAAMFARIERVMAATAAKS